jgi:hypothetical protein
LSRFLKGEVVVKKLLIAGVAAASGVAAALKFKAGHKAEQDLWAEATDPVTADK